MKRPLTREDKENLEKILISKFEEELELNKHRETLNIFLSEQFKAFIDKTYGKELLENFKNCREKIRHNGSPSILSSCLISLDVDYKTELLSNKYDDRFCIGNLQEDSPDQKINLIPGEFPTINFYLSTNFACPDLSSLDQKKKIFYKNHPRNPLEIEEFVGPDKIDELIILFKEYYNRYFIVYNALREYKYGGSSSSTFNYREFLWNIKTWEDLEELNKEWFGMLKEYIKTQDKKKEFNISNLTMNEIFENLDDDLGL